MWKLLFKSGTGSETDPFAYIAFHEEGSSKLSLGSFF
jgi:hypothetical protein